MTKYYLIEPVADAEVGDGAIIAFEYEPRRLRKAHVSLFSFPESDIIKAYPLFVVTKDLQEALVSAGITGVHYLDCKITKSLQYDELSGRQDVPEMVCLEPCGIEGVDDVVFYSETRIKVSDRFMKVLGSFSSKGCVVVEPN